MEKKVCWICTNEASQIEPTWHSCRECYETGRAISKAQDISMSRALVHLGNEIRKNIGLAKEHVADAERKVLKPKRAKSPKYQEKFHDEVNVKNYIDPDTGEEVPKTKTFEISKELYRELEYEISIESELDGEPDFGSVDQQVFHYRQLLDIALLGGDIEWARQLNSQIKQAKGIEQ